LILGVNPDAGLDEGINKMAMKVASPELQRRMQVAIAMIGRGVNQSNKATELEGRRQLALARIENEILLGEDFLTPEDRTELASILFRVTTDEIPDDGETTAEALALHIPNDARDIAPPLNPTRAERIAAMRQGHEREQAAYPSPELLEDPDDIE
jgi:hypothetical protein